MWKAKSPTVDLMLLDHPLTPIIDEGSEFSPINSNLVHLLKMPISRTLEEAQTAGSLCLNISKKTSDNVIVNNYVNASFFEWNLGQCLVVDELGCDVLIGEPAKQANAICTHPMLKTISMVDKDALKLLVSYKSPVKSFEPLSDLKKNALKSESMAVVKLNKV